MGKRTSFACASFAGSCPAKYSCATSIAPTIWASLAPGLNPFCCAIRSSPVPPPATPIALIISGADMRAAASRLVGSAEPHAFANAADACRKSGLSEPLDSFHASAYLRSESVCRIAVPSATVWSPCLLRGNLAACGPNTRISAMSDSVRPRDCPKAMA